MGLKVLSYGDLSKTHPGYHVYLSHHVVKETLATLARSNSLQGRPLDGFTGGG
jgi:hypothetical protein